MFIKINDHRCKDDETGRYGAHFFYEYFVRQTGESDSADDSADYGESDSYSDARRSLKRRDGDSLQPLASAGIMSLSPVHVIADWTVNGSVAVDVRNTSCNITTKNMDIRLAEVVNTSHKVSNNISTKNVNIRLAEVVNTSTRASSKIRNGTEPRIASKDSSAHYPNKVVSDSATRIHHTLRRAKVTSVTSASRRVYNSRLGKAFRAVSNFGLSLAKFTAHYSNVGHTPMAGQRSKPQTNKENRVVQHHINAISPNQTTSRPSLLYTIQPTH